MRTYAQNCGLARALDVLGERWTLLIVRELARGPKRFRDLTVSLEGIGTNLLAARLRSLQEADVVVSENLGTPPGVPAYALSPRGRALVPLLDDLALWGLDLHWPDKEDSRSRLAWLAMTMHANMERAETPAPDGVYEFLVGDEQFWLRVSDGNSQLLDGGSPIDPDVRVRGEAPAFVRLAQGEPIGSGDPLEIEGDRARLRKLMRTFRVPPGAEKLVGEIAGS